MKKFIIILFTGLFFCNVSFAEYVENIQIYSVPTGAECTIKNDKNDLKFTTTKTVIINWSKKKLKVSCSYPGFKTVNEKLSLRRNKDLPSFDFDITEVVGVKQVKQITEAACLGAEIARNPLHDLVCMGIDGLALGITLAGNAVKKVGSLFARKNPTTHTYANSEIKGVKSITILILDQNK